MLEGVPAFALLPYLPAVPVGVVDAVLNQSGTVGSLSPLVSCGGHTLCFQSPWGDPTRWVPQPLVLSRRPPCTRLQPFWVPALPQPATGAPSSNIPSTLPPFDFCSTVALTKGFPHLHLSSAFLPLTRLGLLDTHCHLAPARMFVGLWSVSPPPRCECTSQEGQALISA